MLLGHHFQGQKVKGQVHRGGAYCGGLPPTACFIILSFTCLYAIFNCSLLVMFYVSILLWLWLCRWRGRAARDWKSADLQRSEHVAVRCEYCGTPANRELH